MAFVEEYLPAARIGGEARTPPFCAVDWRTGELLEKGLGEASLLQMVKGRAAEAGLPRESRCRSFGATGITDYLANGGELGNAQAFAGHESPTTTKLYDRTGQEL